MPIIDAFAPQLFAGRTTLVTGGTSGIGLGCARAFAALGARVIATGATEGERSRAAAANEDASIAFEILDVRNAQAVTAIVESLDRLDILVNAAGVIRRDLEHDPDVFADVIDINLTGTMRVSAAAKPKLAAAQGAVVNIASMLTFFGGARVPAYSASKGGIGQLTKSLAAAWAVEQHPRQRRRAGLDHDAADPSPAGRSGAQPTDPVPYADGPLGHAGGGCRWRRVPGLACRPFRDRGHPRDRWRLPDHVTVEHGSHSMSPQDRPVVASDKWIPYRHPQPKDSPPELVDPECHSDRRAHLGAGRGECVVPAASARRLARLLDEPAARAQVGRALAPSPSAAGARLRA